MFALRVATAVIALSGCAHRPLPVERPTSALYRDLERLVSVSAAAGWKIDRVELDALLPEALLSACRVHPSRRGALLSWIDQQIEHEGGDVAVVYKARGSNIKRVSRLLELSRIRATLARSIASSDEDCPFWLAPDAQFGGRQILDDRWVLTFGGGGKGIFVQRGQKSDLNFGGAGRVLFGRAFGPHWTILAGGEAGASASFPKDDAGDRGNLEIGVDVSVPVQVRYRQVNSYYELEVGPFARVLEAAPEDPEPGIHLGVSVGGSATRKRWFLPGVAFGVAVERTFSKDDEPALTMVKLGFRVVVDIGL